MYCEEAGTLVDAYIDGELDLVRILEIEHHIQDCPKCNRLYKNQQSLVKTLREGRLYFETPKKLDRQIHNALLKEARKSNFAGRLPAGWLTGMVTVLALMLAGWSLFTLLTAPSAEEALAKEVVNSHVRSLMLNHLQDVASTDQHTVKPWFNGKLDYSPPVEDFASKGYPLVGGRIDYINNRPVAVMVYNRRLHVINLFVWPAGNSPAQDIRSETIQGYHYIHWTTATMTYWAVSDLNPAELVDFVQLVKDSV